MTTTFDFETLPQRQETGSLKWDKYAGKDILPFWVADMDFVSPPPVIEALQKRLEHGVYGYTKPYDSVEQAVLNYLQREHQVTADASHLVWLPGLVPALNVAVRACGSSEKDAVMTATPVYPPFLSSPKNQLKQLITNDLVFRDGLYRFDFEAMEAAVTPDTRMFILCNPHNPVGRVFDREELLQLADFCVKHDLWLVSDEIHCDLILDEGLKHCSVATLDHPIREKLISLFAPSKTYNLPGLACSFAVIEDAGTRLAFQKAARGIITEVNCFGYAACEAAYNFGEPWRQELLKVLRTNCTLLYDALEPYAPKLIIQPMQATYLAWMDMRGYGKTGLSEHFEKHGIGLSDGAFFGAPGFMRVNFGCPSSFMKAGISRLKAGIDLL